ncbi:bola protein [Clohesyomyces aquaticus]|uniref:Bola protein n=1 Tax=Clohesyomyces aquaticus TaxID=1231657 RepID=A0A1Y1ZZA6_9PLEO|nr:bola protein [Clohesyomyces aquaticus]
MAPSRAILRCTRFVQLRSTPRLLSTACTTRSQHAPLAKRSSASSRSRLSHHPATVTRPYSQNATPLEPPDHLSEGELHVFRKIKAELDPVKLEVQDISGGCGSMYALEIESAKFNGLTVIKQHKLVNSILADEIKSWHGVQLRTRPT